MNNLSLQRFGLKSSAYPLKVAEANDAWKEGNYTRMGQILDELRPTGTEQDLRGWEWNYLDSYREHTSDVVYQHAKGFSAVTAIGDVVAWVENGTSTVHVQNVATNKRIADINVSGNVVTALTLRGDVCRIACSNDSGTVEVWEIASQTKLMSSPSPPACLALNRGGDTLVRGAAEMVTVFDVETGTQVKVFERKYLKADTATIAFSPDDRFCAFGVRWSAYLHILDAKSWVQIGRFFPYNGDPNRGYFGIAWHPDSCQLAIGHATRVSGNGTITFWNWKDDRIINEFPAFPFHIDNFTATLGFDRTGRQLAVGEQGGTLCIWDPLKGEKIRAWPANSGEFVSLSWSDDQQFVNGGTLAGGLTRKSWTEQLPWITLDGTGRMDWMFDSQRIAAKSPAETPDSCVGVFDSRNGMRIASFKNPAGFIPAISCSPIDDRIAYSSVVKAAPNKETATSRTDSSIYIFRPGGSEPEKRIPAYWIQSLDWSPDGNFIVGGQGDPDFSVTVWDATSGLVIWSEMAHISEVRSVAWSPDGTIIASKDERGKVVLWKADSGQIMGQFIDDTNLFRVAAGQCSIAFSPDSRRLVVGYQGTLKIWDLGTMTCQMEIAAHSKSIFSVAWSPDGKRIVSGGQDSLTKFWNPDTGQLVMSIQDVSGVALVSFSPDGKCLATHAVSNVPIQVRRASRD